MIELIAAMLSAPDEKFGVVGKKCLSVMPFHDEPTNQTAYSFGTDQNYHLNAATRYFATPFYEKEIPPTLSAALVARLERIFQQQDEERTLVFAQQRKEEMEKCLKEWKSE